MSKAGVINGIDFDAKLDALKVTEEPKFRFLNDEKIKQLESLLSELHAELGNRYMINPCHIGEGVYIATYDQNGDRIAIASSHDLKSTIKQIL